MNENNNIAVPRMRTIKQTAEIFNLPVHFVREKVSAVRLSPSEQVGGFLSILIGSLIILTAVQCRAHSRQLTAAR